MAQSKSNAPLACKGAILSLLQHRSLMWNEVLDQLVPYFLQAQVYDALAELETEGKIRTVIVLGEDTRVELTEKPPFFYYHHFIPLFAGSPEWIVEAAQPEGTRLVCRCTREFDAQLITNALNGGKS